jgi:hypothetical protein
MEKVPENDGSVEDSENDEVYICDLIEFLYFTKMTQYTHNFKR